MEKILISRNWILSLVIAAAFFATFYGASASDITTARTLSFGSVVEHEFYYTIPVTFHNDETLVNAGRIDMHYDPSALFVFDVHVDALCEDRFLITKEIDSTNGTMLYECGTISPLSGTSTRLATIFAIPLQHGTTTLSFGTTTSIHAHDGFGTQVLEGTESGIFNF